MNEVRNERNELTDPPGPQQDTKATILRAISKAAIAHYEGSPYPYEDMISLWLMQEDRKVIAERVAKEIENFGCSIFENTEPTRSRGLNGDKN